MWNRSVSRPTDQDLDPLAGLDIHKGLFGLLEPHLATDQPLGVHLALADQLDRQLVIAAAVSEAALERQLLGTRRHDGESDVLLAHAALDICSPRPQDVDARLDRWFGTAGVDGHVCADAELVLADQVGGVFGRRDPLRLVGRGGGELAREVESMLLDIDRDDFVGAELARYGAAEQAYWSGTEDYDTVTVSYGGLLRDVHRDCQRLDQGAFLHAHSQR